MVFLKKLLQRCGWCDSKVTTKLQLGFTIVEIAVIIVIISLLATLTLATYAKIQSQSRDTSRKNDILVLKKTLQKYHDVNGEYPRPASCAPTGPNECWNNEWMNILVAQGYLQSPVTPNLSTGYSGGGVNFAPGGKAYFGWYAATNTGYALYVPLESGDCKTGENIDPGAWSGVQTCNF